MLQGCLSALRQQVWPTYAGGSAFTVALRTAKRKHIRIATRKKRTAANKAKKEEEVEKPFVPYKIRLLQEAKPKERNDEKLAKWLKTPPQDDVWIQRYYLPRLCPLPEALDGYREICHPTMLDAPDAPVSFEIELNMKTGEKDSKYLDKASGIVMLPFPPEDKPVMRSVVAICKTPEDQQKATDAGAEIVGHTNVIQAIERGEIKQDDVDYFVCHVDSVLDTLKLRGLLKKKMPDKKKGTLGTDMAAMVQLFARGSDYVSTNDFGVTLWANLNFTIGRLDMTNDQIISNVKAFLGSLAPQKTQSEFGPFLNKVTLITKPSKERLRIDVTPYLPAAEVFQKKKVEPKKAVKEETDEEEPADQARASV